MKKCDDKKVALKLVNQYADQYNQLVEENKSLKTEIKDIKINLKINKEIIEDFYKKNSDNKENIYMTKLKEEIDQLNLRNENVKTENEQLRRKLNYYENVINDSIFQYRESTESLKEKIFILENNIKKKDSLLLSLDSKLKKVIDKAQINGTEFENEVFVLEPNIQVNMIHDDLMLYKITYDKLLVNIRDNNSQIREYENKIEELQKEVDKAKKTTTKKNLEKKRVNSYTIVDKNLELSTSKVLNLNVDKMKGGQLTNSSSYDFKNNLDLNLNKPIQTEEWLEILNQIKLSTEEFDRLLKSKVFVKIRTAIERLNQVLKDRNIQISLLLKDNQNLNAKNLNLIQDNMSLSKSLYELQKMNTLLRKEKEVMLNRKYNFNFNYDHLIVDISMINNTCRLEYENYKKLNCAYTYQNSEPQCRPSLNNNRLNKSFNEDQINMLSNGMKKDKKYATECDEKYYQNILGQNEMKECDKNLRLNDINNKKKNSCSSNITNNNNTMF